MFDRSSVALKYLLFALIATVANIGAQDLAIRAYDGPYSIPLAVIWGTGVGLIIKYLLDKKYIFRFRAQSTAHDGRTFVLYSAMGLLTTAVFWGFEFGFGHFFGTKAMRYLGAAIGLGLGYVAKYQLDKRFVFINGR